LSTNPTAVLPSGVRQIVFDGVLDSPRFDLRF
jgi:hypothetical protein